MNNLKIKYTNFIRLLKLYINNYIIGREKYNNDELEKKLLYFCRNIIKNKDACLSYCFESNKRIIIYNDIYITIYSNEIKILDVFVQEYIVSNKSRNSLILIFDNQVSKKRIDIENKMYENMKKSINLI